ncbi:MAG: hypothetical protein AAFX52_06475 [Pseudomonadota bacterium]
MACFVVGGFFLSNRPQLSARPYRYVYPFDLSAPDYIRDRRIGGFRPDDPNYAGEGVTHTITTGARVLLDVT